MNLNVVVLNSRTVSLGEVRSGKLVNSRMVVVRFTEQEASVPSMIAKVKDALGSTEQLILTDHNGVEILDSEGTRGAPFVQFYLPSQIIL